MMIVMMIIVLLNTYKQLNGFYTFGRYKVSQKAA